VTTKTFSDMKTILYQGVTYKCPFSTATPYLDALGLLAFRRHTPEELEIMRDSIVARGLQNPILVYVDSKLGSCIADGEGRLTICKEVNVKATIKGIGRMTTEEAYQVAKDCNDARRQDSPEAVAARRRERVKEKRAAGMSQRKIAEEENVGRTTIQRDLEQVAPPGPKNTPEVGNSLDAPPEREPGDDTDTEPPGQPDYVEPPSPTRPKRHKNQPKSGDVVFSLKAFNHGCGIAIREMAKLAKEHGHTDYRGCPSGPIFLGIQRLFDQVLSDTKKWARQLKRQLDE
jgi:hypothetical protein